ncbi:hypothetical protein ACFSL6_17865 [Paenibacillus thailandensis]|uniref:Uncharacterized protein n=1 Tax=Paenibacillus thailandensis TaxID=393250 RepID=A0ABW5R296_9BACL
MTPAAKLPDKIENDEQYDELLARIVKGAQTIEDPLLDPNDRQRYMKAYDKMVSVAMAYRFKSGGEANGEEAAHAEG